MKDIFWVGINLYLGLKLHYWFTSKQILKIFSGGKRKKKKEEGGKIEKEKIKLSKMN
ncbi:hypothetical protein [Okeania sp.]|uniref:hypothetical protein n=1 Tax=Okeania sp. TaxID=3100323 RepID=UPI002B4AB467|nr:hypothetical protein [Okeania sp.]